MYRKTWLTIASLFVVSVPLVAQETGGFWSTVETGVTVAAGRGATSDIGNAVSVPWSIRLASVRANSQWGLEGNLEYGGRRTVNGAHFREFGMPVSLVRRIGRGSGPKGTAGTYIGIGYSQTFVAKNTFSTGVMLSGVVASVGQRIALGTYGVFRPEFVALRDWGAARDNLYYSGVMRFSARVGLSLYFPQYW